ncbi:RbsD/FucU domain-containing protein [Nakamurella sp. A5-74]|uniref:RbsD/FucU domain-containing protein n=1 Tax=Nakamurella sp. A5-74 TaxID=3158264 RepID=A0AAU8DM65_9ACTN
MLKNIDPLLTGRLLHLLDEMGHGDVLGLVDRNFPAYRYQVPVIDLRGADTATAASAVLSVFPLDSYVDDSIRRMQVDGAPEEITTATAALGAAAHAAEGRVVDVAGVERFAFYDQADRAMVIIQTGETVPYSCYLLKKGVV